MYISRSAAIVLTVASTLASFGCSGEVSEADGQAANASDNALRSGEQTYARPEVGLINVYVDGAWRFCTATLVAPKIVLTAAQCVGFGTKTPNNTFLGAFATAHSATQTFKYVIDGYRSFSEKPAQDPPSSAEIDRDLALAHLITAVPASVAEPAALSPSRPLNGTAVMLYGWGDRGCAAGSYKNGLKVRYAWHLGLDPALLCAGDSGGPVFSGEKLSLVASTALTAAAPSPALRYDTYAHPYNHLGEIHAQMAEWNWGY